MRLHIGLTILRPRGRLPSGGGPEAAYPGEIGWDTAELSVSGLLCASLSYSVAQVGPELVTLLSQPLK